MGERVTTRQSNGNTRERVFEKEKRENADLVESFRQEFRPATMRNVPVPGMVPEKLFLGPELVVHRFLGIDVLLTPADDPDESQLEGVHAPRQNVERVRAGVHQVELGQDADRASTLGIDGSGELERFRVCEIDIGGRNREDDTVASRNHKRSGRPFFPSARQQNRQRAKKNEKKKKSRTSLALKRSLGPSS